MPKRIEPPSDTIGVQDVPQEPLSKEQLAAILDRLQITDPRDLAAAQNRLIELARSYIVWKAQDEDGPSRAWQARQLRKVESKAEDLAGILRGLDHASEWELIQGLAIAGSGHDDVPNSPTRRIDLLKNLLENVAQAAREQCTAIQKIKGWTRRKTLPYIIGELAQLYTEATGKEVTHSKYRKAYYETAPQSPAGRFMEAFFKAVDPALPPSAVSNELAKLSRRRSATHSQKEK